MKRIVLSIIAALTLLAVPALVLAHPHPHAHGGFGAGFLHPLLGLDHLLAMLGVGLWAAQQADRRTFWLIPAGFITALVIGFVLGLGSASLPIIEFGIVGSLALVGLLILVKRQLPVAAAGVLAGLFAVFHGHAHGAEMAVGLSGNLFGAGFVIASGMLLAAGIMAWRFAERRMAQASVSRTAGLALLAASAVYLVLLV